MEIVLPILHLHFRVELGDGQRKEEMGRPSLQKVENGYDHAGISVQ